MMVAQELIYLMSHKSRKSKLSALKVNMSKAYDRVEWNFMFLTLKLIGFPRHFIELIRACVCTTNIGVNINGDVDGEFFLERGLQ